MHEPRLIKFAAFTGMIGPLLFVIVVTGLTIAESDFMRSLGWDPFRTVLDWPSGLALGPYGWLMRAAFLVSGAMLIFFAYGLQLALKEKPGTTLMMFAGLAMTGLVFNTDPTIRSTPATWHGVLHDAFFAVLGLTLTPAMLLLGLTFQRNGQWKKLSIYTWATLALIVPTFWLKGAVFYVFLLAILIWNEVIAWRLNLVAQN